MEQGKQPGHRDSGVSALGELILTKREAAGLTRRQLAGDLGISRPYLYRLERGEYANPSTRVLSQIVRWLDISVEDIYALTGYTIPDDLPTFGPYVRAKHADWPEGALDELEDFYDFLKYKYSLK